MSGIDFETVPQTIDYSDRDFISMTASLRSYVSARFPQITDFNTASQVQMYIELVAAAFDRIALMQDFHANEAFILTARRLRNVIKHARGKAYEPRSNQAATGEITATIETPLSGNLPIPAGTQILTEDSVPVIFQVLEDFFIPSGQLSAIGNIKNSETWEEEFDSTLTTNQKFKLENSPFISDDSISVVVGSDSWDKVEDFLDSKSTDKHYRVEFDEEDYGFIIFGDGVNGAIPTGLIEIIYQTGGGFRGNQALGTIAKNSDDFESLLSEPAKVTFSNANKTEGGTDKETMEQIRMRAPRSMKALTRTVAYEDFQINLESHVPGVLRAKAFFKDQDALLEENHAYIYALNEDGETAGPALIALIKEFLRNVQTGKPVVATMDVSVLTVVFGEIEPKGVIYYNPIEIKDLAEFKQRVRDSIEGFFLYTTKLKNNPLGYEIDWGKTINWSKVIKAIQLTSGVDHINDFRFNDQAVNTDFEVGLRVMPKLVLDNFDSSNGIDFVAL